MVWHDQGDEQETQKDVKSLEIALSEQNRGNYANAIENYRKVVRENEILAPTAQFQINLIQSTSRDTVMDEKTLRRKTDMWKTFVKTYPKSELIPEAFRYFADNAYLLSQTTNKEKDIQQALDATAEYLIYNKERRSSEIYFRQKVYLERELIKSKK